MLADFLLFVAAVTWLFGSILVAIAADARRRNFFGWFFAAALASPVVAALALIAMPYGKPELPDSPREAERGGALEIPKDEQMESPRKW